MNMSYVRFENTVRDMADCIRVLEEEDWDVERIKDTLSASEGRYMMDFIATCVRVAEVFDE